MCDEGKPCPVTPEQKEAANGAMTLLRDAVIKSVQHYGWAPTATAICEHFAFAVSALSADKSAEFMEAISREIESYRNDPEHMDRIEGLLAVDGIIRAMREAGVPVGSVIDKLEEGAPDEAAALLDDAARRSAGA
jgi:hypothetical protein